MDNNLDLSSVVSLIMQNPDIIAKVAALAKQSTLEPEVKDAAPMPEPEPEPTPKQVQTDPDADEKRKNRERLFSALRPYLSSERAKTLSSVEAMVAIIDSMKL